MAKCPKLIVYNNHFAELLQFISYTCEQILNVKQTTYINWQLNWDRNRTDIFYKNELESLLLELVYVLRHSNCHEQIFEDERDIKKIGFHQLTFMIFDIKKIEIVRIIENNNCVHIVF